MSGKWLPQTRLEGGFLNGAGIGDSEDRGFPGSGGRAGMRLKKGSLGEL